jgi:endogenous inhibitor of DNA gyrase (YacG/DUF329 family)
MPRPTTQPMMQVVCPGCGKSFKRRNKVWRKPTFCSLPCYRNELTKQVGEKNSTWKGGRFTTRYGYVAIYQPSHPRAGQNGYVLEHIVVAETMIGRPLRPNERVHHKNHHKAENNPSNLEVLTDFQHRSLHMKERHRKKKLVITKRNAFGHVREVAWMPR